MKWIPMLRVVPAVGDGPWRLTRSRIRLGEPHNPRATPGPGRTPGPAAGTNIQSRGGNDEAQPRLTRRPLRAWPANARTVAAITATAVLVLVVAACGGGPSSTASGGSPNGGGSTNTQSVNAQLLAFSHCMRSNGVPNFPDPNSSGSWPKPQLEGATTNPKYPAAARACGHLLPDGGPGVAPSPAVDQQIQTDMTKFSRCMRSNDVPNWPDPTLDRGREIFDPKAAGIDTNSPPISAKVHECEHVFPASMGIPPGA
jgi:hypothetical protein